MWILEYIDLIVVFYLYSFFFFYYSFCKDIFRIIYIESIIIDFIIWVNVRYIEF